jgi:hypothetical protein
VAEWLNAKVAQGERVSLLDYGQYRHFLRPDILLGSESRVELEWAWQAARDQPRASVLGELAKDGGFSEVVARREEIEPLEGALPKGSRLAFTGRTYVVFSLPPP